MERLIFHVDVNSAFLSWEAARRVKEGLPDLREIPSCIGGDPKSRRGIVVAKSIPAKKYGVTTGEPVSMALRKCPELVCVPGDFVLFETCSRAFKKICASYAPVMESFSIDEVFLDMSGTQKIYPDPVKSRTESGRNWALPSILELGPTSFWQRWHQISRNLIKSIRCFHRKFQQKCGRCLYGIFCFLGRHRSRD